MRSYLFACLFASSVFSNFHRFCVCFTTDFTCGYHSFLLPISLQLVPLFSTLIYCHLLSKSKGIGGVSQPLIWNIYRVSAFRSSNIFSHPFAFYTLSMKIFSRPAVPKQISANRLLLNDVVDERWYDDNDSNRIMFDENEATHTRYTVIHPS